jgi:hypothetical protein
MDTGIYWFSAVIELDFNSLWMIPVGDLGVFSGVSFLLSEN